MLKTLTNRIANDPQFDLEQQIHACWNVTTDIDAIFEGVCDNDPALTEDQIANALLGMRELYELKFNKLFHLFEQTMKFKRQQLDETKERMLEHIQELTNQDTSNSINQIDLLAERNMILVSENKKLVRQVQELTSKLL